MFTWKLNRLCLFQAAFCPKDVSGVDKDISNISEDPHEKLITSVYSDVMLLIDNGLRTAPHLCARLADGRVDFPVDRG